MFHLSPSNFVHGLMYFIIPFFVPQETLKTVSKFCFPFSMDSLSVNQVGQNFTFVLTDIESKQRFGFCRLSSGAHTCYCILSYLPWFEVFYKLLNILADYTVKGQVRNDTECCLDFLHSLFTLIPENRNLTEYFVAVDVNNMLHLYASMLYERRILICCSKLSTLTACVHGSAAMLFPMHWQHVYIPVLPQHLLDYCCAPMPYLIGVHSSLMEKVRGMALDDVVVLNVDTNMLESPYDDLQSLPNDVVSALKSRLKKVSATTGDCVARAFLKSQAALFGSYRSALQIEPEERITFNEETFLNHRSSAMRQFLQNAIQLQFFKQFIDGRLDLLNSGEGFSDIFEEEINMSEYAGQYSLEYYLCSKGGGAIFNTVKTKANPAMKTVYKFAKDHAKMRIREVKSRLKQKVLICFPAMNHLGVLIMNYNDGFPNLSFLTLWSSSHSMQHLSFFSFSAIATFTFVNFSSSCVPPHHCRSKQRMDSPLRGQPQPYHTLKEVELIESHDTGFGPPESHTAPPSPVNEKFSNLNLLGDFFGCLDEPDSQPVALAKSLEDLRTSKDSDELQPKFTYQRMDVNVGDNSRTFPGLKLSNSYNKLWSTGHEKTPLPGPSTCNRPPSVQLPVHTVTHSPGLDSSSTCPEPLDLSSLGSITIPRPQGRKTPELGSVLTPPTAQSCSKPAGTGEGRTISGGEEFRQALSMSTDGDLLKTPKSTKEGIDLISLLDPLKDSAQTSSTAPTDGTDSSVSSSYKPVLQPGSYPQGLPSFPKYPNLSLNPFTQSLQNPSLQMHYSPIISGNPFNTVSRPPPGPYMPAPTQQQSFTTLPGLYRQHSPGSSTAPPSYSLLQSAFPSSVTSLPHSSASNHTFSTAINALGKPLNVEQDSQKPQDPFGDLLSLARPASSQKQKVEDLRRKWETFD
uniref:DENN domain containing 1A n=1 Tax=Oreochromis niloticus TaxID=8128 RepID=A0A669BKH7_ORENI